MEHWLKMVQLHMKNILGKIDKMTILHNARNASQIKKTSKLSNIWFAIYIFLAAAFFTDVLFFNRVAPFLQINNATSNLSNILLCNLCCFICCFVFQYCKNSPLILPKCAINRREQQEPELERAKKFY